ncbi:MAG TPA: DNA translocase FtsK [Verrucomicrobiae bacterium]|nr:DNA translocase FtsK [Verrucomicrobiae bacterium]
MTATTGWVINTRASRPRSGAEGNFNFEVAGRGCYATGMAKKSGDDPKAKNGFNDVIGLALLFAALILLVAQWSFDKNDISSLTTHPNKALHNWIGLIGAWLGYASFFVFGGAAYVLPLLLAVFGGSYLLNLFGYLRERVTWSTVWAGVLLLALAGLLFLSDDGGRTGKFHVSKGINSAGGALGYLAYGQTRDWDFGFCLLGNMGAGIVCAALVMISLLFLTNFHLGVWIRAVLRKENFGPVEPAKPAEEQALEKRAQELEKQKRKLEEEVGKSGKTAERPVERPGERPVEKTASGLGADGLPVPEPTVRDLSVPQAKGPKVRKTTLPEPKEATPTVAGMMDVGDVIRAGEIAPTTTEQILGRKSEAKPVEKAEEKPEEFQPEAVKPDDELVTTEAVVADKPAEPVVIIADAVTPTAVVPRPKLAPKKPKPMTVASVPMIGNYQLPSMDFLQHADMTIKPTESKEELMANARLMQQTLAQFDIEVSLGDITKGPTITRYELHPAPGVKLEKILNLNNNLAAALKAERINILAPVPGKSSVGVEVPNLVKSKVIMRDLFESDEWRNTKARIPIALGKDVYGHPIIADLAEMPHMLIAGSTGSGKSVCINSIIASLLYRFSPDQLRFVMIDPKVVELQQYNALPHLVVPVVTDPKKVLLALRWVVNEMEKRYKIFARVGVRNVKSFNDRPKNKPLPEQELELPLASKKEKVEAGADGFAVEIDEEIIVPREEDIIIPEKLSYIVVIIDELADLMLVAPADVEMAIARITQMARAAGIHCIVATQRPSVDVITGVIKANIPARIAFQVASRVDSRTILDAMGADKLLGKGDMLFLPPGSAKLNRAQGALITDQELENIVGFIAKQGKPSYEMEIHQQLSKPAANTDIESGIDEDEDLIQQCIEVIRSEQKASVSLMQRRLRLGYTRAARIMDELEGRGIVGPSKGAEPRDILIDLDGEGADGGGQSAV